MSKADNIEHPGIIEKIENNTIFVKILAESACISCRSKKICSISDIKEKIIEISFNKNNKYKTGDRVTVVMEAKLGFLALFLGYILPFLILISSIIALSYFIKNEPLTALISFFLLAVYYFILFLLRQKLKKKFDFKIKEY
ncbi:MAG: SoxR reducing system RseC family protein [Bacteroidales bacterium]|nr:SoxR reducing system RseC family protein [Bacteroidales bacterium]